MKIAMIAGMVIGMIALNGCSGDASVQFNNVKKMYPGKPIQPLVGDQSTYIVIDTNKVMIVHYNSFNVFLDSTTYIVPSKCK